MSATSKEEEKTTTIENRHSSASGLFWVVVFGVVLYVVLDAVAQVLPPHYNPLSQAESDLAVGQFGYIMAINFVNRGLLSLLFIFAFIKTVKFLGIPKEKFKAGIYLLGIWAIGALLLAFFPTDVPATPVSWHGAIHLVVAIIAFIGGAFGTFAISRNLESMKRVSFPLSILCLITWAVEFLLPFVAPHFNDRIGGLTERLFLGSVLLWIAITSIGMARLPKSRLGREATPERK